MFERLLERCRQVNEIDDLLESIRKLPDEVKVAISSCLNEGVSWPDWLKQSGVNLKELMDAAKKDFMELADTDDGAASWGGFLKWATDTGMSLRDWLEYFEDGTLAHYWEDEHEGSLPRGQKAWGDFAGWVIKELKLPVSKKRKKPANETRFPVR